MVITKEVKVIVGICAVVVGRIIARNLKDDIHETAEKTERVYFNEKFGKPVEEMRETVEQQKKLVDEIKSSEKKEFLKRVNDFKESIHYDEKMAELDKYVDDGVKDYKKDIRYDEVITTSNDAYKSAINEYKEQHGYYRTIESLERKIKDAENTYAEKKALYKVFTDKDEAKALKKVAKAKRDEAVKSANEEIDRVKSDLIAFDKQQKDNRDKIISNMKKLVVVKKDELTEDISKNKKDINKVLNDTMGNIQKDIESKRSEETNQLFESYPANKDTLKEMTEIMNQKFVESRKASCFRDDLLIYLKVKGWHGWQVITVGSIPAIGGLYAIGRYLILLTEFAKKLDGKRLEVTC